MLSLTVFVASVSVFVLGLSMHYLFIWLMGAVAYIARPKGKSKVVLLVSIIGTLSSILYWQLSKDTKSIEFAVEGTNKELIEIIMSLMVCLLIQQLILFEPSKGITKWAEKKVGSMAKFSYTLYLSHRIVFLWIILIIPKESCDFSTVGVMTFVAIIVTVLIICWFLYLFSERYSPQIKTIFKNRFIK